MYAARMSGQFGGSEPGYASQCIECGQCVDKCPQNLEIPQFLASVAEQLEGPDLEKQVAVAKAMFSGETS
jgi:predicted aldo/keto reductase-like oxidoreductase